jgi:predicted ATPase
MTNDTEVMQLQSVRIRNFKAIVDSKVLKLGPVTVFVGHNGSGKSSVIEALETYQSVARDGLDLAMQHWLGIEHVRHKSAEAKERAGKSLNPIAFDLRVGVGAKRSARVNMTINNDPAANRMYVEHTNGLKGSMNQPGAHEWTVERQALNLDQSVLQASDFEWDLAVARHILSWQFMTLQPERMGLPVPQQRTGGRVRLAKDGSNIADYLLDIQRLDDQLKTNTMEGIVNTMAYVLPYARDLQASLTSELERKAYLQLTEGKFKVPGWMLSSGTLRVLALLATLRHPQPPPLLLIEEIENGLDPRSIHLLVEEIRTAVLTGATQVVMTTHSPYLLDLLKLDQLVLVARDDKGEPHFHRPASSASLAEWSKEFAPGRLYTMGSLHEAAQ